MCSSEAIAIRTYESSDKTRIKDPKNLSNLTTTVIMKFNMSEGPKATHDKNAKYPIFPEKDGSACMFCFFFPGVIQTVVDYRLKISLRLLCRFRSTKEDNATVNDQFLAFVAQIKGRG